MDSCPIPIVADLPTKDDRCAWKYKNLQEICQKAELTLINQATEKTLQVFSHTDVNGSTWNLVYEKGSNNHAELSLQICRPSTNNANERSPLATRLNILLTKGSEVAPFKTIEENVMCLHPKDSKSWKIGSVLEILSLLQGEALSVDVILETFDYSTVMKEIDEDVEERNCLRVKANDILESFENLLEDERGQPAFSDFNLIVQGETFNLHKAILAVRCPLFKHLASVGYTDCNIAEELVSGLSKRTVEILVRFIYSGKSTLSTNDTVQVVEELLAASSKWGVSRLLKLVDGKLIHFVTTANADHLFELACIYEMNTSVTEISEFIARNRRNIFKIRKAKCTGSE